MSSERRVLVFRLEEHCLAISALDVQEIVLAAALIRAPGQPAIVSGFLNLRGGAVPVIRLHRLFDLEAPEPKLHTPVVVLRGLVRAMAVQVDRVEDVVEVDERALLSLTRNDSFNDCAVGEFTWEGRTVVLLSTERLLLIEESRRVAELQSLAQGYLDEIDPSPR